MKKITAMALAILMIVSLFGCASDKDKGSESSIKIVCTFFPIYDWVNNIISDMEPSRAQNLFGQDYKGRTTDVELILLYDNGADLHSYQATASDLVNVATCDLLIYVGGDSDKWIEDALKNSENPDQKTLCLMDVLNDGLIHAEHDHEEGEDCEETFDEHVWLSLRNAELFCNAIRDAIEEIDGENKALYSINAGLYTEKLRSLDKYVSDIVKDSSTKEVIFADRFPFTYLMRDYGITCHAAFGGCSSETEASFETVITLADTLNRLGATAILTTEAPAGKVAQTVITAAKAENVEIFAMNSMQSVSKADLQSGKTYLSIMEENVAALKAAMN